MSVDRIAATHPTELAAVAPYSALMAASQPLIAQEVLDSFLKSWPA
jgi:hypothetical protein